MSLAAIGLGANLDAGAALDPALAALREVPGTSRIRCSARYLSAPWGGARGGRYHNAVALLDTDLRPWELLAALGRIERALGRIRGGRYAPRGIDLDLLWMAGVHLCTPRLTLPHPHLLERRFALAPLCELAPDLPIAPGLRARAALARCPDRGPLWRA